MQSEAEVAGRERTGGVELDAVDKAYGTVEALRGVSLRVRPARSSRWPGRAAAASRRCSSWSAASAAPDAGSVARRRRRR